MVFTLLIILEILFNFISPSDKTLQFITKLFYLFNSKVRHCFIFFIAEEYNLFSFKILKIVKNCLR